MTNAISQLLLNSDRRAAMHNACEMQAIQQQTTSSRWASILEAN
jgi:hypothetical protein